MRITFNTPGKEASCILFFFKNSELSIQLRIDNPKKMIKSAIFEPNLLNMSPKSILLLVTIFLFGLTSSAQYTEKINSNRPGTSQGAFSVGNNVLQLEGGMGLGKEKHKILDTRAKVFNLDYTVRYGLLIEQLEIRLNGSYRADGVTQTVGANEQKINRSNFEINTLGAKYLIYDPYKKPKKDSLNYDKLKSWKERYKFSWKTLIPAVSAYAGVNFVAKDNPFTFPNDASISPIFVVAAQNNGTTTYGGDWAFVTNIIVDKVTTDNPAIGWIFTATHTVNEQWAGFVEYQGQKSDFYSDNILRIGGAYLFDQDLQFDANIAFNFKDTPSIFTCSVGASYRFDWHTKDEIIEEPGLEGGVKEGEEKTKMRKVREKKMRTKMDWMKMKKQKVLKTIVLNYEKLHLLMILKMIVLGMLSSKTSMRDKFRKEESRRLKREEKASREAEKAAIKAEKEKQKMIEDIDAELDKMEEEQGVDEELDDIDKQLKELEQMEKELNQEEKKEEKQEEKKEQEAEDADVDAEYEKYQKEQEKAKKAEEKRRKKEEKKRLKDEKKRKKEEKQKKDEENEDDSGS